MPAKLRSKGTGREDGRKEEGKLMHESSVKERKKEAKGLTQIK
jgi:hypothetical protein